MRAMKKTKRKVNKIDKLNIKIDSYFFIMYEYIEPHQTRIDMSKENIDSNNRKKKCFCCSKKCLIYHTCGCGNTFCLKHRSPYDHNCRYVKQDKVNNIESCEFKKIDKI